LYGMEWRCVVPNRTTRPKGGAAPPPGARELDPSRFCIARGGGQPRERGASVAATEKVGTFDGNDPSARRARARAGGWGTPTRAPARCGTTARGRTRAAFPKRGRVCGRGERDARRRTNSQFADEASAQRRDVCPGRFGAPACRFTARKDFFPCGGSRLALLDVSGATRALATSPRASVASEPNGDHASPSCLPGRAPGARPRRARPPLARPTAATFRVSSPRAHPSLGSIV